MRQRDAIEKEAHAALALPSSAASASSKSPVEMPFSLSVNRDLLPPWTWALPT
jgi:hypothetical protein